MEVRTYVPEAHAHAHVPAPAAGPAATIAGMAAALELELHSPQIEAAALELLVAGVSAIGSAITRSYFTAGGSKEPRSSFSFINGSWSKGPPRWPAVAAPELRFPSLAAAGTSAELQQWWSWVV